MLPLLLLLIAGADAEPVKLRDEPRRVHAPAPEYPAAALAAEVEADIVLDVVVDAAGRVVSLRPAMGQGPFLESALAAVRAWRWEADRHPRRFPVRVTFRIPGKPIHHAPFGAVFDATLGSANQEHRPEAFREMADRGIAVLPQLRRILENDADPARRCAAAGHIGRLGTAASSAAPALLEALERGASDPQNQCALGYELQSVDPRLHETRIEQAVRERDAAVCRALVSGMVVAERVAPALLDALFLDGCDEGAARGLHAGRDASTAPALVRALSRPSPAVRRDVWSALAQIASGAPAALTPHRETILAAVRASLATPGDPAYGALTLAARLGRDAAPLLPDLVRALETGSPQVRLGAAAVITSLGIAARSAGPTLLRLQAAAASAPSEDAADKAWVAALEKAIAATRAGRDDARIADEDEVRAAVVEHVIAGYGDRRARFTIVVLGEEEPERLAAAIRRRGADYDRGGRRLEMGAVVWKAGDLAEVSVTFGGGMDSSGSTYVVALVDARWRVVGSHGGWITGAPTIRPSSRNEAA